MHRHTPEKKMKGGAFEPDKLDGMDKNWFHLFHKHIAEQKHRNDSFNPVTTLNFLLRSDCLGAMEQVAFAAMVKII